MRRALLVAATVLFSSCFRVSDPFYVHKPLEAPEPLGAEYSLVFLTLRAASGLFGTNEIENVWFTRVDPHGRGAPLVGTSTGGWFRVFRPRPVKDGHFLFLVPPGVYEMDGMVESDVWNDRVWRITGEAKLASRIHITRPGVYDLGTFSIQDATWGVSAGMTAEGDSFSDERMRVLRDAVRGKSWEKLLDQKPARKKPRPKSRDGSTVALLQQNEAGQ
ncbi:MAG: hypothetical protein M3Y59_11180 [Myxococcota bacterium]|nr:hypothetical protein [Myxococcota bacterium]